MADFKETDLYEPIRAFLEEEGYQVQAEVKGCDIAAVKDGQLVIVELKKAFNLKLVYQGEELRQVRLDGRDVSPEDPCFSWPETRR